MSYNLAELFERVADVVPEREAIVTPVARCTYAQLDARSSRLAHALAPCGAALDAAAANFSWALRPKATIGARSALRNRREYSVSKQALSEPLAKARVRVIEDDQHAQFEGAPPKPELANAA